jgi:hypothetical protein
MLWPYNQGAVPVPVTSRTAAAIGGTTRPRSSTGGKWRTVSRPGSWTAQISNGAGAAFTQVAKEPAPAPAWGKQISRAATPALLVRRNQSCVAKSMANFNRDA